MVRLMKKYVWMFAMVKAMFRKWRRVDEWRMREVDEMDRKYVRRESWPRLSQ